jgi:hypothetical protein
MTTTRSTQNRIFASCCLALALLPACSTQQIYHTTQAWQRNQCYKLPDAQERNRCLSNAEDSFDDYQKQSDAATPKH